MNIDRARCMALTSSLPTPFNQQLMSQFGPAQRKYVVSPASLALQQIPLSDPSSTREFQSIQLNKSTSSHSSRSTTFSQSPRTPPRKPQSPHRPQVRSKTTASQSARPPNHNNRTKSTTRKLNPPQLSPSTPPYDPGPAMFTLNSSIDPSNVRSGPRIGALFADSPRQIKTPHFVIGSARGSTPHLTPDMVDTLPEYKSMQISLGEVNSLLPALQSYQSATQTPKPYHSMLCLRPDQSIIASLRNPVTDLQYYHGRFPASKEQTDSEAQFPYQLSAKLATTRSDNGVIRLTPQEFITKSLLLEPDMIVLGGQNSSIEETKSRAEKTMRRNLEWCDQVYSELGKLDVKIYATLSDYEEFVKGSKNSASSTSQHQSKQHQLRPLIIAPLEGGSHLDKRTRNGGVMSRKGSSQWVDAVEPKFEDLMSPEVQKTASEADIAAAKEQLQEKLKAYQDKILNEGYTVDVFPDGFHLGGLGTALDSTQRVQMVKASLEYVNTNEAKLSTLETTVNGKVRPFSRLRMTTITGEPLEVLDLVLNGIDYLAVTYPQTLTEEGLAMKLPYKLDQLHAIGEEEKQLAEASDVTTMADDDDIIVATQMRKLHAYNILNLRDEQYIEDNSPLDPNCTCYACKHHSRSYLNHLLNTQEMLAEVLLMLHNMHQYSQFFTTLQDLIEMHHLELAEFYATNPSSNALQTPIQTKIPAFSSPIQTSLTRWLELITDIIVPHSDILSRNSRRRYIHQDTSDKYGTGAPSGPMAPDA